MIAYLSKQYDQYLHGPRETVSVHFRFASSKEVAAKNLLSRKSASASWYLHLMETEFDPAKVVFLVFSEDSRVVMPLFVNAHARNPSLRYVMVYEDFATSLALMSMCQHHISAHSSYSFWGVITAISYCDI